MTGLLRIASIARFSSILMAISGSSLIFASISNKDESFVTFSTAAGPTSNDLFRSCFRAISSVASRVPSKNSSCFSFAIAVMDIPSGPPSGPPACAGPSTSYIQSMRWTRLPLASRTEPWGTWPASIWRLRRDSRSRSSTSCFWSSAMRLFSSEVFCSAFQTFSLFLMVAGCHDFLFRNCRADMVKQGAFERGVRSVSVRWVEGR
mmetsp:Transcript_2532/g.6737  ORF Transcript_2532/g.6737 Transcript_2532/m.6737 type:complete len:205 (-) Transcript_2532:44-658(-)